MTKKNKGLKMEFIEAKWNKRAREKYSWEIRLFGLDSKRSSCPGGSSSSLAVNKTGVLPASLQSFERIFWHEFLHKKTKMVG